MSIHHSLLKSKHVVITLKDLTYFPSNPATCSWRPMLYYFSWLPLKHKFHAWWFCTVYKIILSQVIKRTYDRFNCDVSVIYVNTCDLHFSDLFSIWSLL